MNDEMNSINRKNINSYFHNENINNNNKNNKISNNIFYCYYYND